MPTIDCGHGNGRRNRLPHLAGSIVWRSRWGRRFRLPVEADFHRPSKSRKRLCTPGNRQPTTVCVVEWGSHLMTAVSPQEIVSAHSPDSDDAFMFYGLATKKVRSSKVTFRHILEDIESLNRHAMEGQYDLSAISYHAYPYVAD